MKHCGAAHPEHDTACVLAAQPNHLDHLDDAGRTWINESVVQAHDSRTHGSPMALVRDVAMHTRRTSTARFNTKGLPGGHPDAVARPDHLPPHR